MSREILEKSKINIDSIPQELKEWRQWICWNQKKEPISALGDFAASSTKESTWASFEEALSKYERDSSIFGIGFVFTKEDPYVGIDLDECRDPLSGDIKPWAIDIVNDFCSYTEISPSGMGLHIIIRGTKPGTLCQNGNIEIYEKSRYFTITGERLRDSGEEIYPREKEIKELYIKVFGEQTRQKEPTRDWPSDPTEDARNAEDALGYISPDDYETWIRCGFALKSLGDEGFHIWDRWSHANDGGGKYKGTEKTRRKWDSFGENGVTLPTIFHLAKENGWTQKTSVQYPPLRVAAPGAENGNGAANPVIDEGFLSYETQDHEGHAQCVKKLFGDLFLWCEAYGWMWFNGRYWDMNGAEQHLDRKIVVTLKKRRKAGIDANNEDLIKSAKAHKSNVVGTKTLFQSLVIADVSNFDSDPAHLNCENGVLNLKTGDLKPHGPEWRFTYCLKVPYEPGADYTEWTRHLSESVRCEEMVGFLQRAVGYSLTGYTNEEAFFYIYGPPRSGKGVFTETLLALLGSPVAKEADFETFTAKRTGDTQNFDLAPLKPCRIVFASESNRYAAINPQKIKQLTGGNQIYCAFKHRDHFSYRPRFKIWMTSNHKANVDVDDEAAWCRVKVIEFPKSKVGKEDKTLKMRMAKRENLIAVLAWAAEGARLWFEERGLEYPEIVKTATDEHREELDHIQAFLDEQLDKSDNKEHFLESGLVYGKYKTWCEDMGYKPKYQVQFSKTMTMRGFGVSRRYVANKGQRRVFLGIKEKEPEYL